MCTDFAELMPTRPSSSRQQPPPRDYRSSPSQPLYNRAWARASHAFLMEFPLCGMRPNGQPPVMSRCRELGLVRAAEQTDHVEPHKGDPVKFWDRIGNWQALCRACGARKSQAGL